MVTESDCAAACRGDRQALERVAREIWPVAFRVAVAVLSDRYAAQDAAQEAVISVLDALPGLRAPEALAAYVRKAASRCAYRELQRMRRELPTQEQRAVDPHWIGEEYLDLRKALGLLDDEDRIPLLLHYGAGMTSAEIGEALGIAATAVRFRLMRGRSRLRQAISPEEKGDVTDAAR